MSDFEGRVAEVLRSESEAAPDAIGLADAARGRARARRRTRVALVGGAAVVVLAVPVGVVALGGDGGPGKTPVAQNSTATDPGPAGRWESWHGVSVQVPEDWQYGDLATWCADGGSAEEFRVGRPGGTSPMIACTPGSSYGVTFQEIDEAEPFDWPVVTQTGEAWPAGTYVGAHGEDGVLVTVAGPDREEVSAVLSTVTAFDGVDPHGCTATADEPAEHGELMSICRYDADGRLVQSERLSESDSATALQLVQATVGSDADCFGRDTTPSSFVLMSTREEQFRVVFESEACETRGVFTADGGERLGRLTPDVLWWAISPGWSGAVDGAVPLPTELRSLDRTSAGQ